MTNLPLFPDFDENNAKSLVTYHSSQGDIETRLDFSEQKVWLTQRDIAVLLGTSVQSINRIINKIKKERGEAIKPSINKLLIVANDGRQREIEHYDLTIVNLVGARVHASERVIAFQNWVGEKLNQAIQQNNQLPSPRQTKEYRRALDSGYSHADAENWVLLDRKAKEARKEITAEWARRGGNIPKLTNFVTRLATGKRATDWKTEWHIDVSPRQFFSPLKKQAIAIVETFSAFQHRRRDSQGDSQLAADIADMAEIINWEKLERLEDRDLKLPDPRPDQRLLGDGR